MQALECDSTSRCGHLFGSSRTGGWTYVGWTEWAEFSGVVEKPHVTWILKSAGGDTENH